MPLESGIMPPPTLQPKVNGEASQSSSQTPAQGTAAVAARPSPKKKDKKKKKHKSHPTELPATSSAEQLPPQDVEKRKRKRKRSSISGDAVDHKSSENGNVDTAVASDPTSSVGKTEEIASPFFKKHKSKRNHSAASTQLSPLAPTVDSPQHTDTSLASRAIEREEEKSAILQRQLDRLQAEMDRTKQEMESKIKEMEEAAAQMVAERKEATEVSRT